MRNKYINDLDKNYIQSDAQSILGRKLTHDEYGQICMEINEALPDLVQEKIHAVIDFNEMLKRNKNAEKTFPHYKVLHRNANAYQPNFEVAGVFKTEEDARDFLHHDFITDCDEWRVIYVRKSSEEKEVYKVNC